LSNRSILSADDVYVAGDMVTMSDGRICWPYVNMTWDLSQSIDDSSSSATGKKMSIACVGRDGATDSPTTTAASVTTSATASDGGDTPTLVALAAGSVVWLMALIVVALEAASVIWVGALTGRYQLRGQWHCGCDCKWTRQ
jgi:hypothetical protein